MIKKQDLSKNDIPSILIIGDTGVGKTHFSATASLIYPTIYVNAERRRMTLKKFIKTLNPYIVDSVQEVSELFSSEGIEDYKVGVIDSLDELQMKELVRLTGSREVPNQYIYNQVNTSLQKMIRSIPEDLILVCTSMIRDISIKEKTILKPAIIGQFGNTIAKFFNIVGFMEKSGNDRIIRFTSDGNFTAKVEFVDFPDYIKNPTFEDIVKLVEGGVNR